MWIKTTGGHYLKNDAITAFFLDTHWGCKYEYSVEAKVGDERYLVKLFKDSFSAQKYIEELIKKISSEVVIIE